MATRNYKYKSSKDKEIVNVFSLGCSFLMLSSFSFLMIKWVIYNIKTPKYPLEGY